MKFAIIILSTAFAVLLYLLLRKNKKVTQPQDTQEFLNFPNPQNSLDRVNILNVLKFTKDILFLEAKNGNNTIFFSIDQDMPKILDKRVFELLTIINSLCKFLIFEIQDGFIKVEILGSKNEQNTVFLDINIISDKEISQNKMSVIRVLFENQSQCNDSFLLQAKSSADELGMNLFFDNYGFNFGLNLSYFVDETKQICENFDFKVLICEENETIFEDLSRKFTKLGCEVKPNLAWHTVQAHIDNFVYIPDIIILDSKILKSPQNIRYLNENWSKKDINFVILEKNTQYSNLIQQLDFKIYKFSMPYFFEDIMALCHVLKNKQENII